MLRVAVSQEEKWYITHNSKSDLPLVLEKKFKEWKTLRPRAYVCFLKIQRQI